MNYKFGAYLIIPFKYSMDILNPCADCEGLQKYELLTMDINENIKNMFNNDETQSIGNVYKIDKQYMFSHFNGGSYDHCVVIDKEDSHKWFWHSGMHRSAEPYGIIVHCGEESLLP